MSDDEYEVLPSQSSKPVLSPALANSYSVRPETLTRWNQTAEPSSATEDSSGSSSRFPYEEKLNRKLILWQGNLTDLVVDAIVNTTNERLNDQFGVSGLIFQRAGPDLAFECNRCEGCHTGEAVLTKGYNLPASHVIHTVGPRFSVKYQTAAENALHGCYRRSLELLKEHGLESIAFPLVNTDRKGYPKDNAAHIALRTVRRFLERYGNSIHTVIFCMENQDDFRIYERTMPLYFPRDKAEEARVINLLPKDVGNEIGESVQADRKIRISAMPGMSEDEIPYATVNTLTSKRRSTYEVSPEPPDSSSNPGTETEEKKDDLFGSMQDNPDDIRRRKDIGKSKDELDKEDIERRYANFLRESREQDLSDMEALNFIYPSGVDSLGRPIIIFVAQKLPAATVDLNRVLLYMIKLLDPIVEQEYTVIYFHTNIQSENKPPFGWLRQVYEIFNRKYKKNLKRLYIVHPTFWVKLVLLFATPFISKKFWRKVTKVEKLTALYEDFDPKQLKIDQEILKFDQQENASDYAAQFKKTDESAVIDPNDSSD